MGAGRGLSLRLSPACILRFLRVLAYQYLTGLIWTYEYIDEGAGPLVDY